MADPVRFDKLENKVGDSEDMYCANSICKHVRPHIWRVLYREDGDAMWYDYILRCKFCGTDILIYTTQVSGNER